MAGHSTVFNCTMAQSGQPYVWLYNGLKLLESTRYYHRPERAQLMILVSNHIYFSHYIGGMYSVKYAQGLIVLYFSGYIIHPNSSRDSFTNIFQSCFTGTETTVCLSDCSRSVGNYNNNTRVICCPVPGHPESAARGTSRRTTNHEGVVAITPHRPWSIPIITWLNNFVRKLFTLKYVQNHHIIKRRRLLASIVTSRISP